LTGTIFRRVIDDDASQLLSPEKITRVAFCSGKVYYELAAARKANKINDVALVRVEQVSIPLANSVDIRLVLFV
jgi:2-oxoglutarate dehydrogenase E1 component